MYRAIQDVLHRITTPTLQEAAGLRLSQHVHNRDRGCVSIASRGLRHHDCNVSMHLEDPEVDVLPPFVTVGVETC